MSQSDKLLKKLLSKPKDFTYNELKTLLRRLGYKEAKTGKTSGSRVAFLNHKTKNIIRLHKPHPGNELKKYQISYLIEELRKMGVEN
ncbi:type II toxin-antitoxin system HicA family toxin [bacterium]|nr:type II toxin-antitoxin system HicA family toxin [bacterium]